MIIRNRLELLASHIGVSIHDFQRRCAREARQQPERFGKHSRVYNLFKDVRTSGSGALGSKRRAAPEHVALVSFVTSQILEENGASSEAPIRLDDELFDFLHALELQPVDVMSLLTPETRSAVEFFIDYSIQKHDLFPSSEVTPNSQLHDKVLKYPPYFSLLRYRSTSLDHHPLVEEKIEIEGSPPHSLRYTDHRGAIYEGIPFVCDTHLSASLYQKESDGKIEACHLAVFLPKLFDDDYLVSLQRVNSNRGKVHTYKCVGIGHQKDFEVGKKIGPTDGRQILYYFNLDNSNPPSNASRRSFEMSVDVARANQELGHKLFRVFIDDPERFSSHVDAEALIVALERHAGDA